MDKEYQEIIYNLGGLMFFNLKKIKRFFLFVSLSLIVTSAFAKNANGTIFEEEEIPCEKLPEAFTQYDQDNQLYKYSLRPTLTEIEKTLKKFSTEKRVIQKELLEMIANLQNVKNMISDNEYSLVMQSDNILFSMEECLTDQE